MKATNYIIIGGGALALLLLFKNKQKTKLSTTGATTTSGTTNSGTTTGGTTTGGTTTGANATAGTSQVTSFPTPTSNEPEQVFGLGLPTGMDLPILTAGTGIPTEVAIQQGGVNTTPSVAPSVTVPSYNIFSGLITQEPAKPQTDAPRPYKPIVNLQEFPSYGRESDVIIEDNYRPKPSNTDNWVIPRPTAPYADVRPYNPKDYRDLM